MSKIQISPHFSPGGTISPQMHYSNLINRFSQFFCMDCLLVYENWLPLSEIQIKKFIPFPSSGVDLPSLGIFVPNVSIITKFGLNLMFNLHLMVWK